MDEERIVRKVLFGQIRFSNLYVTPWNGHTVILMVPPLRSLAGRGHGLVLKVRVGIRVRVELCLRASFYAWTHDHHGRGEHSPWHSVGRTSRARTF